MAHMTMSSCHFRPIPFLTPLSFGFQKGFVSSKRHLTTNENQPVLHIFQINSPLSINTTRPLTKQIQPSATVLDECSPAIHSTNLEQLIGYQQCTVGLDGMQRANSSLEDFCRSYFMFHGLDVNSPESIFKYLPVLSFVESYIYQVDYLNEEMLNTVISGETSLESRPKAEADYDSISKSLDVFKTNPLKPLLDLLDSLGLLTERIKEELRWGEQYWALERKLCSAMTTKEEILMEDVMKAIHLKTFDYRVMNLLLYQLRGEKVNEMHWKFLSFSELLMEMSDDLMDYEDDVIENNFNVLRMFVRIYGPSIAPFKLLEYINEAEKKIDDFYSILDPELYLKFQNRCEEAAREGEKIYGYTRGRWTIPPVIEDEDLYRYNRRAGSSN